MNSTVPTKQKPLVYNFLGEINQSNSMVLGYNDFYLYLESIFESNSMSPKLLENIFKAEYFIFIGISFDMWYVHLFMRILEQHDRMRGSEKFAVSLPLQKENIETHCREQYKLASVFGNIDEFIQQFYQKCDEEGILRQPNPNQDQPEGATDHPPIQPIPSNIAYNSLWRFFVKNDFSKIFEILKEGLIIIGDPAKAYLTTIRNLESRLFELIRERPRLRAEEYSVQMENFRHAVQELINTLETFFPNSDQ